ncbi:DUF6545 domain-containing protein [Streptomyces nojiriensis]|uniref:DUF6545 domain-containing protein n=1 Tax=Streptomyces nojiriensis TaxID=66374 RepID=UPI0036DDF21F
MHEGISYYIPAAVLGAAVVARLPGLLRGWRSATVRLVNALLLLPCAGFVLCAPPTIAAVNRFSGISNLSALLVQCLMTAYSCACLLLLAYWREETGDHARTRRRVRAWKSGCCVVITALVILFALGDVPVERPRDFDTYYATTPFISAMLVLYLVAYVFAGVAMTIVCGNWMRSICRRTAHGTRTAVDLSFQVVLLVLVIGAVVDIAFGSFKLAAVVARWAGRDWEALNQSLSPFVSVSQILIGIGLLVPAYGPGLIDRVWHPVVGISALRPLWQLVHQAGPTPRNSVFLSPPWYAGPEQVLLYRMTTIHDWMLELCAYCTDDVRALVYHRSKEAGATDQEAAAAGLAVMFQAAADSRARKETPETEQNLRAVAAVRSAEAEDRDLLVSISRVLAEHKGVGARRTVGMVPAGPAETIR